MKTKKFDRTEVVAKEHQTATQTIRILNRFTKYYLVRLAGESIADYHSITMIKSLPLSFINSVLCVILLAIRTHDWIGAVAASRVEKPPTSETVVTH